ncbi:MAG: hypothetical protein KDE26_29780, partial [Bacteroidetes bacterium]|nr:hypothetical protein [Bacteroidota bacterium]
EYLVLIDESGPEDYQAKLFEQLMVLLKQEEVPIHLFRFRNDPRHCYNQVFPEGLELEVLAQRFYRHKLLIFSKGTFLVDPHGYELHEWVEPLIKRWAYRALLTPEPVTEWSIREKALQACFTLLPTDLESQKGITAALLAEEQPDFDQLKEELLARKQQHTPLEDYDLESIEDLQHYLGDAVFQWLAATTVYPEPSWEMTLNIGQALEKDTELIGVVNENYGDDFTTDALDDSRKLVTYENLTKLSSIPWLREGKITPEIRSLLKRNLDPETEKLARNAALELIESVNAEEGSGIAREKKVQTTIQESALNPQDKLLSKKLRFLWGEDLLSKKDTETLPQNLQPNWQMELLKNIPVKAVLTVILSMLIVGIGGWQVYQYSQRDLFEKYFEPFPAENLQIYPGSEEKPVFAEGISNYKTGNYKEAINDLEIALLDLDVLELHQPEEILQIQNQTLMYLGLAHLSYGQYSQAVNVLSPLRNDETFGDLARWNMSLAFIAQDQEEQAKNLLMELARQDESSNYQILARNLLGDL